MYYTNIPVESEDHVGNMFPDDGYPYTCQVCVFGGIAGGLLLVAEDAKVYKDDPRIYFENPIIGFESFYQTNNLKTLSDFVKNVFRVKVEFFSDPVRSDLDLTGNVKISLCNSDDITKGVFEFVPSGPCYKGQPNGVKFIVWHT